MLHLEAASGVPFYRQIATQIALQIRAGALRPGDPLPSVRALARELLVSVMTTGRAYDTLEAEGWITRRQGSGTFVCDDIAQLARLEAMREARAGLCEAVGRARLLGLDDLTIRQVVEAAMDNGGGHG